MKHKSAAAGYLRTAMVALAVFLPAISLLPLGTLWLWQKGYLIYWVAAAMLVSATVFLVQLWMLRTPAAASAGGAAAPESPAPEPSWTPAETAAWSAVEALAVAADPMELSSRDALVALGLRTIETVARNIHPADKDPLWRFTVPEALALVERVAGELRPFVIDTIPLGDRLTVAQVLKVYRWRSAIDVAEKAYDLWRIVRVLNPVTAVANEARERLTKKLYSSARDEFARRLTQGFVRAVGRAAIDLYGGRLRVTSDDLAAHVSAATTRDRKTPDIMEPLRILVAGQISAGKSSLINALIRNVSAAVDVLPATTGYTAYALSRETLPPILLVDSPGVEDNSQFLALLASEAGMCDLIVWVAAANRADRGPDRAALDAIRTWFAARPDRRQAPVFAVATHVDLLRPYGEWAPPYEIDVPLSAKAQSIRSALQQISSDLAVPMDAIVPVVLGPDRPAYNVDRVWTRIEAALPQARNAQLVRRLRGADQGWRWRKLWSQTLNAGRAAARSVKKT